MKADELNKIDFKAQLKLCYDDIQPHLEVELEKLRKRFIELPDNATESDKLASVQDCVEALNALEENDSIESGIDTDEREILCDYIYKMGDIVGLNGDTDYVDEWRDW